MTTASLAADLERVVDVVREATRLVADHYRRHLDGGIDVELKGPGDPVTEADREANAQICGALERAFPDAGIVAEESAPSDAGALRAALSRPRVFFVDPLDGTREFVDRNPEFAVMVGMAAGGRAVLGVIGTPTDGAIFGGAVGEDGAVVVPAFVDRGGRRTVLRVSASDRFTEATMVVSRSHRPAFVEPLRKRLGALPPRPCGSAGVKVLEIAQAHAHFYPHDGPGMKLWDVCAPEAILAAAGGRVSDLDGYPIDYARPPLGLDHGLLASNGLLHAGVLSAVGWARRQGR